MHAEVDAVLDELHGQVTKDTEVSLLFCDGLGSCITTVCMYDGMDWMVADFGQEFLEDIR
jgi:hypothetical protein